MIDLDNPVYAGILLALVISALIVAIAMDKRQLPLGQIKWIP